VQHRYVGDVGDFSKLGLLRILTNHRRVDDGPSLRLGVVWCLARPDNEVDGKIVDYLEPESRQGKRLRPCDPDLYDRLRQLVHVNRERNLGAIQQVGALPNSTVWFEDELSCDSITSHERIERRAGWMIRAQAKTAACDVVFFDPDNGFEIASSPPGSSKATKFVYYNEIVDFVKRGQSVVVYQHLDRRKSMVADRLNRVGTLLPNAVRFVVRARFGTARAYIIIAAPRHASTLRNRAEEASRLWTDRGNLLLHTYEPE
jgi:hypothetical protein